MAEGRQRDEWNRFSVLLALTANCHRDAAKSKPFAPDDFTPFPSTAIGARQADHGPGIPVDGEVVKVIGRMFRAAKNAKRGLPPPPPIAAATMNQKPPKI